MLALSDEALARLCIAATGIRPRKRGPWLKRIARQLDCTRDALPSEQTACSRGAGYTRAWRERARNGRILLRLEVDEAELAIALVGLGFLDPNVADDKGALTAAAEKALAIFCEREVSHHDAGIADKVRSNLALVAIQRAPPHDSKKRK